MLLPKLGIGQMAFKDNIGALQEAQMGEGPSPRDSMAKPLGMERHYLGQFLKCIHACMHAFNFFYYPSCSTNRHEIIAKH